MVLLASVLLSSCTPSFDTPEQDLSVSTGLSDKLFTTEDGSELPLRKWFPPETIKGIIIAVHGFNDYSNFINDGASFFNDHGIGVYSYDQRGFGGTKTMGFWSGREALTDDLATFIRLVKRAHPDVSLFVLGDSMGSAVTISTMVINRPRGVDGIILVAPAVWARTEMPFYQRFALWLTANTLPWLKVSGKSLDIVASDNTEMLRELGRDPLVIKETRIDVLYGLSNLMDFAYSSAEELQNRSLVLYGQKDEIIPKSPVMAFYKRLPDSGDDRQQLILYENGYHMLLRDLQAEVVLLDIVDWINNIDIAVSPKKEDISSLSPK